MGFAVGNAQILRGLGRIKTNLDSGVFQAVQYAGIAALTGPQQCIADNCRIYQERRDVLVAALREMGFVGYEWTGVARPISWHGVPEHTS